MRAAGSAPWGPASGFVSLSSVGARWVSALLLDTCSPCVRSYDSACAGRLYYKHLPGKKVVYLARAHVHFIFEKLVHRVPEGPA